MRNNLKDNIDKLLEDSINSEAGANSGNNKNVNLIQSIDFLKKTLDMQFSNPNQPLNLNNAVNLFENSLAQKNLSVMDSTASL